MSLHSVNTGYKVSAEIQKTAVQVKTHEGEDVTVVFWGTGSIN